VACCHSERSEESRGFCASEILRCAQDDNALNLFVVVHSQLLQKQVLELHDHPLVVQLQPDQAARLAREWDIRIYTISIGDPPRTRKVETDKGTMTIRGTVSTTEKVLSSMAEVTGGIFRTAHDYDTLQAVYSEIDKLERSRLRPVSYTDKKELFLPFALFALGLMVTENALRSTVLRKVP